KGLGTQVRGEYHCAAQREQRRFVFVGQRAQEVDMVEPQAGGLGTQIGLERSATHDDDGQIRALYGIQQDVQALVVAQCADEKKEVVAQACAPRCKRIRLDRRIGGTVKTKGNDLHLVGKPGQDGAGGNVIR